MKKISWVYFALLFVLGLFAGTRIPQRKGVMHEPQKGINLHILQTQSRMDGILDLVEQNYVDTFSFFNLENAAITGMLEQLDPHSVYIPASEASMANEDINGDFDGIGVQFRVLHDTVLVIMPVAGGPSEKVGIKQGDRIISAEDIRGDGSVVILSGKNLSTEKIMRTLRGPRGSVVRLGILPYNSTHIRYVDVVRNVIPTYSVDASFMLDESVAKDIGYIKLSKFNQTTSREVAVALSSLQNQGMRGLVLDLRGNGGGLLSECLVLCDMFLPRNSLVLYTHGLRRPKTEIRASGGGKYQKLPLVVLIDQFSASASEIFAGAMQDNDRAVIVGRRTFGKGLVQEQMNLRDGSILRLTVAKYYTPSGRSIQKPYRGAKYEEDLLERYTDGELFGTDTTSHTDTVKYYTIKGRVVYGGGGIEPDINVPYTIDTLYTCVNRLSNSGVLYDYAFSYVAQNRSMLGTEYPTLDKFKKNFVVTDVMVQKIVAQGKQKGIKSDSACLQYHSHRLKTLVKATIARDLYDDKGFYSIYSTIDDDILKAINNF
ncbi:MAG: S41 family peptidase [Bacteroidales bacterium]|jgi:carboxyl-terminal processing protease|nr:S41 family peptidase [Bacteroidales bacterium]